MQLFLVLFLKLLIFQHGVAKARAFPESISQQDVDEETRELSFEYSNSMDDEGGEEEESTTTIFVNDLPPTYETNPPIITQMALSAVTASTTTLSTPSTETSDLKFIHSQTPSPILMKLIAPYESTTAEPQRFNNNQYPTTETILTKTSKITYNNNNNNRNHQNLKLTAFSGSDDESGEETPVAAINKKPRLLDSKVNLFKNDAETDNSMEDTTMDAGLETENNETNIDIGEEITTMMPTSPSSSTSKRPPKNIEIFKTRPNELLRFYVEDSHLRSPVAALVNKKSNPLNKAKKLWKAALRPNSLLDIMVVSYDSEGIKSTYNLTNTKAMMSTLDKIREENSTDQESKTFYSILRTGQLVPFDSAIFLSTDGLPNDTEHQLQASMFLLKKRIRLYLIMFDDKSLSSNETLLNSSTTQPPAATVTTASTPSTTTTNDLVKETGFLGQLALLTGGDIIYVPNDVFQNEQDGEMGFITLIRQNKLKAINQDPVKDFHENELKNETETLGSSENRDLPSVN